MDIRIQKSFKKNIQRDEKSNKYSEDDFKVLKNIIRKLKDNEDIEPKFRRHKLIGNLKEYEGIHIKHNWVLVFKISDNTIILVMIGTHTQVYRTRF
ncbi:type II toxin-antitoxin system mRNA interferase toxin, RelE/StbE family [Thiotrichales bacterium HSG1]|nr:type II toxin-antitoxin system mRNA interferase toxin, RelE/StbE family [Thiotrichales bacterium HSG1]